MQTQLDTNLDRFFKNTLEHGTSVETELRSDLDLKLEAAAVYYFCGRSPETIQFSSQKDDPDPRTVSRWIKEVAEILELRPKPKGRPKKLDNVTGKKR